MFRFGLLVALLATPLCAQETPRVYRVPFCSVNGMILLDAAVNDRAVELLLDTGADNSIVSPSVAGVTAKLDALKPEKTTGASGDYTKAKIDLRLEKRHWIERPILVMDLSEASKRLGTRIDGVWATVIYLKSVGPCTSEVDGMLLGGLTETAEINLRNLAKYFPAEMAGLAAEREKRQGEL